MIRTMLRHLQSRDRLYVEPRRLDWRVAWSQAAALDIGMAVYLNPAPQFQLMGTSSNRLCMFLAMGVPVIASHQESFRFLEDYGCGVLVKNASQFRAAIRSIAGRLDDMKRNAARCWREYVDTESKYRQLVSAIQERTS
jgi:glycosyltransferase involved in cell wall biosynthesis